MSPLGHRSQLYFIKEILNHKYLAASLASLVAQTVKNTPTMQETWVQSLGWEDLLEKGMATHSSILAWRIPGTEQPGWLQSIGLHRVDTTEAYLACMHGEVSCLFDIIHIFVRNGYYRLIGFFF